MSTKFTIYIDLFADYAFMARQVLSHYDYDDALLSDDSVVIDYFNLQRKLILPSPRKIHKSKTFCCPPGLQNGLTLLEKKIEDGENLASHQSTKIVKPEESDDLLFHWDIYHLHLGTATREDGFVERTGPLLYARFTYNDVYFLNIYDHHSWSKKELIKVLHDNWPQTIENWRLKDATGLSFSPDDVAIKKLRKHQINTAIDLKEGIYYLGPGYGVTASGRSAEAVMKCNDLHHHIMDIERNIHERIDVLLEEMFRGRRFEPHLFFKLVNKKGKLYIHELHHGLWFDFNSGKPAKP